MKLCAPLSIEKKIIIFFIIRILEIEIERIYMMFKLACNNYSTIMSCSDHGIHGIMVKFFIHFAQRKRQQNPNEPIVGV